MAKKHLELVQDSLEIPIIIFFWDFVTDLFFVHRLGMNNSLKSLNPYLGLLISFLKLLFLVD